MPKIYFASLLFVFSHLSTAHAYTNLTHHKLGGVLDYWNYEEPGLMEDKGVLGGVEYEFRNTAFESLAYQFNAELLAGRTRYNGADLQTGSPLAFDQTNTVGMLQFFAGPVIEGNAGFAFIPKIGLLYRKLIDADDDFAGDYQRDQDYTVIPVGFDIVAETLSGAQWTVSAWVSAYFSGTNKTHLTDVGGDRDLTLKQDKGQGLQASVTYAYDWWYVTGMIRTWKVEDSELKDAVVPALTPPNQTFLEPENETVSYGARFGWRF